MICDKSYQYKKLLSKVVMGIFFYIKGTPPHEVCENNISRLLMDLRVIVCLTQLKISNVIVK